MRIQIDVVGDQKFSRAKTQGACRGMELRVADVGQALVIAFYLFTQALELPLTDVFEVGTVGARRGGLVKINRDAVARPYFAPRFSRQRHAIFEGDAFD